MYFCITKKHYFTVPLIVPSTSTKQKKVMKAIYKFIFIVFLAISVKANGQDLPVTHNPKVEIYLSPANNKKICPDNNALINPRINWKINPLKNKDLNPIENTNINPRFKPELNPAITESINPLLNIGLHPSGHQWKLFYLFNKNDELAGFLTQPSANVLLCFDVKGEWTCYYVRSAEGTYNLFDREGTWTGNYICYDNNAGYNQFDKEGNWTGMHIK